MAGTHLPPEVPVWYFCFSDVARSLKPCSFVAFFRSDTRFYGRATARCHYALRVLELL